MAWGINLYPITATRVGVGVIKTETSLFLSSVLVLCKHKYFLQLIDKCTQYTINYITVFFFHLILKKQFVKEACSRGLNPGPPDYSCR